MFRNRNRLVRCAGAGVGLALASSLLVAPPAQAGIPLALPEPTGAHPIGTTSLHLVDEGRADPWRPERRRELMVDVTYPARDVDGSPRQPWMPGGVAEAMDEAVAKPPFGIPRDSVSWDSARRHAHTGAPIDHRGGPKPVVLLSPGFNSPRENNSVLADDLASRGYVVVSLSHTYESMAVEFPGGRVEKALDLGHDPKTMKTAIDARVADTRFVLDELGTLDAASHPAAPRGLRGMLDLSDVGMLGHSYGGYTAAETMYHDDRIDAGGNLDGRMAFSDPPYNPGEAVKHGLDRPFMLMGSTFEDPETGEVVRHDHSPTGADRSWREFWDNQRGWRRDLTLIPAAHNSYSDLQALVVQFGSLLTPEQRELLVGTIDPGRSLAAQRAYLGAFFDLHLRDRDNHLLDGPSPLFPEVAFVP